MSDTSFVVVVLNFVRRRKRRESGSHQQPAPVIMWPWAAGLFGTVARLFPAVLGLASLLFLADVLWHESLKSSDAWAMRKVDQLSKWGSETPGFDWLASSRFKDDLESGAAFSDAGVSLVTLSPEAHSYFFGRQSPLPRGRLACLISVFADHLKVLHEANPLRVRRVVGLDFDVTPVAGAADALVGGAPGAVSQAFPANPTPEDICDAPASTQQMQAALRSLQQQAEVVAIIYPRRHKAARALRNDFIRDTCRCPANVRHENAGNADPDVCASPQAGAGKIWYASAQVLHPPLELVTEYPTKRKPASPSASGYAPPSYFPTLGAAMAFVGDWGCAAGERGVGACRPQRVLDQQVTASQYCRDVWDRKQLASSAELLLDDRLADQDSADAFNLPNAFEYENIKFGPAQSKIVISYVYPPPESRDTDDYAKTSEKLRRDLTERLKDIRQSSAFILAIDSGTTEDKFLVPVLADETVGGWLHAAIALSETQEAGPAAASGPDGEPASGSAWRARAWHVVQDLMLGLVLAGLMTPLAYSPVLRAPVFTQVAVAVWPLLAGLGVTTVALLWAGRSFGEGHWHNPLLMCAGFVLHVYLEGPHLREEMHERAEHATHNGSSAEPAPHASKSGLAAFDQGLRMWLQIVWCHIVVAALLFVAIDAHALTSNGFRSGLFGVGWLLASAAYWLLASRQWTWLPLPWREAGHKPH